MNNDKALEFVERVLTPPNCLPEWERGHWEVFRKALKTASEMEKEQGGSNGK